jgi:ubiquitin C-terminal hydrolase
MEAAGLQKTPGERGEEDEVKDEEEGIGEDKASEEEEEAMTLVKREALKRLWIRRGPPVLTLHLKRFKQGGRGLQKNPKRIRFSARLDLSPWMRHGRGATASSEPLWYRLFGVVVHRS